MTAIAPRHGSDTAARIGRMALHALYVEMDLWPKPGLVSPRDQGSHDDMNLQTFVRSAQSLRGFFRAAAMAGARGAEFDALRRLGLAAEARMLEATGGINAHRGAIFSLGLLAAAAGCRLEQGHALSGAGLGKTVAQLWGNDIMASGGPPAARRAIGARREAALGFPILFQTALPCLTATRRKTGCRRRALVQTLFAIMAELEDTNLLNRGGCQGLDFVQNRACAFLTGGGVFRADWEELAIELHQECVARRLSPGGAADMLAASWFVHCVQSE